tara:strand:+ start:1102 stop:1611 length:510 start_codon:yes stop_codon:yes gene_type:complete
MSLNSFTKSTDYLLKQWMNVGCNDIKCSTLEVNGQSIVPSTDHSDSASFNTTMTINDATLDTYSAYYHYNNNVLTLTINVNFTIVTGAGLHTLVIPLPSQYSVKLDTEQFPAVGFLANNVSTPFTSQSAFTSVAGNSVSCDYRQNGVNTVAGQIGNITFTGSFLADPVV